MTRRSSCAEARQILRAGVLILSAGLVPGPSQALMPVSDIVTEMLDCVAARVPEAEDGISLRPQRVMRHANPRFHSISADLGWHENWHVLLEITEARGLEAYETFDPEARAIPFGRMATPARLRDAMITCGVVWRGLWRGKRP